MRHPPPLVTDDEMMPTLTDLLADLQDEYREARALVAPLTASDRRWDRPTPAEGWAVRDQISHLAFFDDAGRQAVEEPEAFAHQAELALSGTGDPMATHLARGRSIDGDQLLAWWSEAHGGIVRALSGIDADQRVPWYGPSMGARSFVTARLMETWAHGQDVADALGIERTATDRLRHIAHLGVRTRSFSYAVHGREVPPGPLEVSLTAPSGASWDWLIGEADGHRPSDPEATTGVSSVHGPALDFCLVVTQRRNISDTSLVVEGPEAEEWISIAQAFAGPPGAGRAPRSTRSPRQSRDHRG